MAISNNGYTRLIIYAGHITAPDGRWSYQERDRHNLSGCPMMALPLSYKISKLGAIFSLIEPEKYHFRLELDLDTIQDEEAESGKDFLLGDNVFFDIRSN